MRAVTTLLPKLLPRRNSAATSQPLRKSSDRSPYSAATPSSRAGRSRPFWNASCSLNPASSPGRGRPSRQRTLDRQGERPVAPSAAAELRAAALPMWDALVALVASVFIFLGALLQIFWRHVVQGRFRGGDASSKSPTSSVVAERTRTAAGGPFASSEETGGGGGGSSQTSRQPAAALLASSTDLGDESGVQGDLLLPGDYPDDVLEGGGDGSRVVRRGSLRPSHKEAAPVYKDPVRALPYTVATAWPVSNEVQPRTMLYFRLGDARSNI